MFSKLRTTIPCMCAVLLLAVLAMPQLAEAQGYNVQRSADVMNVTQYANNALVNNLTFKRTAKNGEPDIADAESTETLTIKIGYGLLITNDDSAREDDTASFTLWCDNDGNGMGADTNGFEGDCQADGQTDGANPSATISNKDGSGVITITIGSEAQSFVVAGVRVDASALAVDAEIMASVTSSTDAGQVNLGGSSSGGSVSGVVGKVAAGLKVTAATASSLACSTTEKPSITVAEGFADAWGPTNLEADTGMMDNQTASIKVVLDNFPDGATIEWPEKVSSYEDDDKKIMNGTLMLDEAESSSNGKIAVYTYEKAEMCSNTGKPDNEDTDKVDESMGACKSKARSFMIVPSKVKDFTGDAALDISAMLFPMARRGTDGEKLALESELSFEHPMQAPEDGKGEGWLVISECVTYLLYPFVTCGASAGWSTGITVSNTTADGNIFGAFDETTEQSGSVVMYGFPQGQGAPAEGEMVEPVVSTLSTNLMAGDTVTEDCGDTTMAGMQGYAIIRAGFQHARGMAFVMGNFADGAGIDVTHGYMAEVIDDPQTRSDAIE